ncbi:hypothetical protein B0H13DRAFT_2305596 [Mycena leptocephala]|nr:hypothetical protein B0H13DRAFT_2305596 [Mycena leptocephala]
MLDIPHPTSVGYHPESLTQSHMPGLDLLGFDEHGHLFIHDDPAVHCIPLAHPAIPRIYKPLSALLDIKPWNGEYEVEPSCPPVNSLLDSAQ